MTSLQDVFPKLCLHQEEVQIVDRQTNTVHCIRCEKTFKCLHTKSAYVHIHSTTTSILGFRKTNYICTVCNDIFDNYHNKPFDQVLYRKKYESLLENCY